MECDCLTTTTTLALFFPEKFNSDKKLLEMAESLASLTSKNYRVLAYNQRHVLLSFVNELVDLEKTEGVGVWVHSTNGPTQQREYIVNHIQPPAK